MQVKQTSKYQRRLRPVRDDRRGGGRRADGLLLLLPLVAHPHRVLVHVQGLGIGLGRRRGQRMRAVVDAGWVIKENSRWARNRQSLVNCFWVSAQDISEGKYFFAFFKCTITPFLRPFWRETYALKNCSPPKKKPLTALVYRTWRLRRRKN